MTRVRVCDKDGDVFHIQRYYVANLGWDITRVNVFRLISKQYIACFHAKWRISFQKFNLDHKDVIWYCRNSRQVSVFHSSYIHQVLKKLEDRSERLIKPVISNVDFPCWLWESCALYTGVWAQTCGLLHSNFLVVCCIIILTRILRWRRWPSYSLRLLKMTPSLAAPSRIRYIHGRRIWSVTVWISSDLSVISHRCRCVCVKPLLLSLRPPTAMCAGCR